VESVASMVKNQKQVKRADKMGITKKQLIRIITEEYSKVLNEQDNPYWVGEMKRILTEIDGLYKSVGRDHPSDLELFEDLFSQNVSMNFPWIKKTETKK
jgi:hypothetical protein